MKKVHNLGARSHICEDSSVFVLLENAHSFGLFFYRVLKQKRYSLKSFCVCGVGVGVCVCVWGGGMKD